MLAADSSAIGSVGVLTVGTRGRRGPGEVRIKIRGGSETFIAWSETPLPRGATVLIIDERRRRRSTSWSGPATRSTRWATMADSAAGDPWSTDVPAHKPAQEKAARRKPVEEMK